jgi:hypothetical protein
MARLISPLVTICTALAMGVAAAMLAPQAQSASEASIPFASSGGIDNWQSDGDSALFLRSRNRDWYRAELVGACSGLSFATTIGYEAEANGSFESTSAIVVDGQRCPVAALQKIQGEPPKK